MVAPPLELLAEPDRVRLALSPPRRRLLDLLAEPASATELAARLGLSRQRVNYHLKALEAAGLVEQVDRRQRRGFVERVLRASAAAYVVDPGLVGGDRRVPDDAVRAQDRFAAEHLVAVAGDTVRDVARMQASAERAGTRLLTFTIEADVTFAEPADIERFATDVAGLLAGVAARYDTPGGRRYRILAAGHPSPRDGEEQDRDD